MQPVELGHRALITLADPLQQPGGAGSVLAAGESRCTAVPARPLHATFPMTPLEQ
jgi:hypothetical protein